MLNRSLEIGADYIATGHYAKIRQLDNGRYAVTKSVTDKKDQTYALYNLTQKQLSHTLFPIGEYEKTEVRRIAQDIGLTVANKKDSQEICFIPVMLMELLKPGISEKSVNMLLGFIILIFLLIA